jgi:hypothetical protein
MNRLIGIILLIIFPLWSFVWSASYRLQLKNGNELKTSHYWEEGDEIKFYVYGGIAGIQKGFVTKVTISDLKYKDDTLLKEELEQNRTPSALSGPKPSESFQVRDSERENKSSGVTEGSEATDFDYYREKKATLKAKLEDALLRNREATARKDAKAKELTRQEYLKFSRQIIDLGDELKRKNKGVLPDWWKE